MPHDDHAIDAQQQTAADFGIVQPLDQLFESRPKAEPSGQCY